MAVTCHLPGSPRSPEIIKLEKKRKPYAPAHVTLRHVEGPPTHLADRVNNWLLYSQTIKESILKSYLALGI